MFSAWNSLSLTFFAPPIKYWCSGSNDTCLINGFPCNEWTFEDSPGNIIRDFNLVCDRSPLISTSKSAYMFGTLCVVMLSQVADRIGRRPVILAGIAIEIIAGSISAISPSIWLFVLSRFLLAIGNGARWGTGFVLLLEVVGTSHRDKVGIGIEFGWALGYCLLPAIALYIPDWRYLQMTCTMLELPFLPLGYFMVTESPRWLISQGRYDEAVRIIKSVGKVNGIPDDQVQSKCKQLLLDTPDQEKDQHSNNITDDIKVSGGSNSKDRVSILDVWADSSLRVQCLLLYLAWVTNGFVYYGLSFNTNSLAGDPYVNFFLSGLVEVPAYILCLIILRYSGRKSCLVSTMSGAGVCFLLIIIWSQYASQFSMAGKFFITCSFAIIYLYTGEIFPTVARTVGLGSASLFARVGAIVAPFVKELGEFTSPQFALVIFGALSFASSVLVFLFGRETRGVAMQDLIGLQYSNQPQQDEEEEEEHDHRNKVTVKLNNSSLESSNM